MQKSTESRLLSSAEVQRRLGGIHRVTICRWDREGRPGWPEPIFLGKRKFYREDEIEAFLSRQPRSWTAVRADTPDDALIRRAAQTGESLDALASERERTRTEAAG